MKNGSKFPVSYEEIREIIIQRLKELNHPERINNWALISGGAETGSTYSRNFESYKSIGFRQRLINNIEGEPNIEANMFGKKYSMPVAAAPLAVAVNIAHENGFIEIAKACAENGIPSSIGYPSGSIKNSDVINICENTFRIVKPLKSIDKLIDELVSSQKDECFATGIDIDSIAGLKTSDDAGHFGEMARPYSKSMLNKARQAVNIPFIVKGVMSVEDALDAKEIGADIIVISTHAGYSLDYCLSPLEVITDIRSAVGDEIEIYVDSGIYRGNDVLKAIAMGANGVLLGRLMIWGLLLGGSEGISWMLHLIKEEMKRTMMLIGASTLEDVTKDCLVPLNEMGKNILKR